MKARLCRFGPIWILLALFRPTSAGIRFATPSLPRPLAVDLIVDINPAHGRLDAEARLAWPEEAARPGSVDLNLNAELTVAAVSDGAGRALPYRRDGARLSIDPGSMPASGPLVLRVRYGGSFSKRNPDVGFFPARVGPGVAFGFGASWYPTVAEGERRSRGTIAYRVPAGWTVAGVGRRVRDEATPEGRRVEFEVATPAAYSFAAGPFQSARGRTGSIETGVYLLSGGPDKAELYRDQCARIMDFLAEYYGGFRGDGLSLAEIPQDDLGSAGGGGWEGLVAVSPMLLPEGFFLAPGFAHEIGHAFWGGLDSADGVVLREGLAQVSMGLYLEKAYGGKALRAMLKDGAPELLLTHSARLYFHAVQAPLTGAVGAALGTLGPGRDLPLGVRNPAARNALHTLANSKGWFVFMMLRDLIGPEAFRAGLRGAMTDYAGRSLSLAGLRAEMEKAAGLDLGWFFEQWFFRAGAPEYALESAVAPEGAAWRVKGRVLQTRDLYRASPEIVFEAEGKRELRVLDVRDRETSFSVLLPFRPERVLLDPDYKILRWTEELKE